MFRAVLCSSSGGQIVLLQHLVSSLSVKGCTVCRLRADITIYTLHYNPRHVSSSTLLIFRRINCIITSSGIVTLCKQQYRMADESGLSPLSTGVFPGGKGGRCVRLTTLPPSCAVVMKSGDLNFLEPSGPLQACNETALPLLNFGT